MTNVNYSYNWQSAPNSVNMRNMSLEKKKNGRHTVQFFPANFIFGFISFVVAQ